MLDFDVVTIGDNQYTLAFPLKALLKAEKVCSKSLTSFFTPAQNQIPDISFSDLLALFKVGLNAQYPKIDDAQADKLFYAFLEQGDSIAQQMIILWIILGKAMGFFRKDLSALAQKLDKVKEAPKAD